MREPLRESGLVHEQSAHPQHARDLVERGESTSVSAANVITGAEVDHEIEAATRKGQIAHVRHVQRSVRTARLQLYPRVTERRSVDVDANESVRRESLSQYR